MTELSENMLSALRGARRRPYPAQEINPGIVNALMRRGYIDLQDMPSPFKSHKPGKLIPHVVITDAGRAVLEGI